MRELKEDTFSGNKDEDAHDHIDWVLNIVGLFNILGVSKDAVMHRVFPFTLMEPQKDGWTDSPQELSIYGISSKRPLSKGIAHLPRPQSSLKISITLSKKETNHYTRPKSGTIPRMTPAQALTAIQTMIGHSQKWHDGTTSKNIGSSSSNVGLAALVNKLDNLGCDMKKLKENVHAIQFHIGPPGYYNKTDNRPPYGEKRQSLEELLAKHQEESA
ncbi:hypothetical protein Tco_0651232 [Tanacetum coccineum]